MSDIGPSHIINIKKEKRETDEETKQILRMLEKDDVGAGSWGSFLVATQERVKASSLGSWNLGSSWNLWLEED